MSGVPSFTDGELAAVITATGIALEVVDTLTAYDRALVDQTEYDDLSCALSKLRRMAGHLVDTETEEESDGAANHL